MNSTERRAKNTPRVAVRKGRLYWEPSKALRALGFKGAPLGPVSSDALNRADELNEAADRAQAARGAIQGGAPRSLGAIAERYLDSPEFSRKAASSQKQERRHVARIRAAFGDAAPIDGITAKRVKDWYLARDAATPHEALNQLTTLRSVYAWAISEDLATGNPAAQIKAKGRKRRRRIATRAELWAMVEAAERIGRPSVALYCIAGITTMQREADVLNLSRRKLRTGVVQLTQEKTGEPVRFKVHPDLAARVDWSQDIPDQIIINERTGQPYGERAFQRAWAKVRAEAARALPSIAGLDPAVDDPNHTGPLWAEDLRRSGMVWAAQGGAAITEICSVSGHSLDAGTGILETYLPRERVLANRAVARLDLHDSGEAADVSLVA